MSPGDRHQLAPLLQQSRTGNAQALNALLGRLRPYLQALVRSWLGPDFLRQLGDSDIVQDALLKACRHFAEFRGQGVPELLGWLKRIAYHAASDRKRQLAVGAPWAGELPADVPCDGMMPVEILQQEEEAVRVTAAMERLSERRREVIQLRVLDGLAFSEISRRLGGSAGSLRVLFLRAVQQLRLLLERLTMNVNEDLAIWGEPPAAENEEALAAQLDNALQQLERGEPTPVGPPIDLIHNLTGLRSAATTFRQQADLLDTNRGDPFATAPPDPNAKLTPLLPDPFPGEFRVLRELGQGAFGKVWLAADLCLRRLVALKTLRLEGSALAEKLAALQNEAGILAQFSHPNIVQVYAWRQSGGDHYLVLELIQGGSLADKLNATGPLPWDLAARYIADVGDGLVEVHARGIVHRDIKPDNILWRSDKDEALLTDFGISVHVSEAGPVGGTPLYMAPEAFLGEVSPALDVYSLAATLFHLVTGEPPFVATTATELRQKIAQGLPPVDLRCQEMPEPLEQVIRSGLTADPGQRPALQQFVEALRSRLNQSLADSLSLPADAGPGSSPVNLRLVVSRAVGPNRYQPIATTRPAPGGMSRNMKKVPRPPEQASLRSGDRVRIEVQADRVGYITVFNVGPTGDLNLLYPDEPPTAATPPTVQAGLPLHVTDVVMEPPAGRERLFAVWTRRPLPLQTQQLHELADRGELSAGSPYQATRDMVRVKQSVQQLPPEDWQVVVLQLEHNA